MFSILFFLRRAAGGGKESAFAPKVGHLAPNIVRSRAQNLHIRA